MGTLESIQRVAKHVLNAKALGHQVVVVVSAMAGETNRLLSLAKNIDPVPHARELDALLACGEQMSMTLLAMTLQQQGVAAISLTGQQAGIYTNDQHNDATISHIDIARVERELDQDQIVIVAGFQGVNALGDITTLGRGGSDTSAVVLAGYLSAAECQIFTDVDGVYSCDPRLVKSAQRFDCIDFPTMTMMARAGAKVLHLPCVEYAQQHRVPLRVLSTFDNHVGTLVKGEQMNQGTRGISVQKDLSLLSFAHHERLAVEKQCQILAIDIFQYLENKETCSIVIKRDCVDRLLLARAVQHVERQEVSLVSLIGLGVERHRAAIVELLERDCMDNVALQARDNLVAVLMTPSKLDSVANMLHRVYVESLAIDANDCALSTV